MKVLLKLLKGVAIGIANVIPGFSGGTMALILNIYDEFVSAFADIVRHPIQVIKKSWAIFIGLLIGIILALFTIAKLLEVALLPTILFFVGLILGPIPTAYKKTDMKPMKVSYIITLALTFIVIVGLPLLNENHLGNVEVNILFLLSVALMGVLSSSAMVLPGVSGSMILMVFGYYAYIISSLKDAVVFAIGFDFASLWSVVLVMLFFLVGVVVGVVLIAKLIRRIYTKYANLFNIGVLGLLLASPFAIIIASNKEYNGALFASPWWMYLIGVVTLAAGILLSYYSERIGKKIEELDNKESSKVSE